MYVSDIEIERIIFKTLDLKVVSVTSFSSNNLHCVYDVKTETGPLVIRFSKPDSFDYLKGSIYWLKSLKNKGVRVPEVLYVNDNLKYFNKYFIIIERLNGCDLGYVYPDVKIEDKKTIAKKIVEIQNRVSNISKSKYPGKKFIPTERLKKQDWYSYITDISSIAKNLEDKSIFDYSKIFQFEEIALKYKSVLNSVEVKAYLDDLTIKNVIVDNGKFSGVVDVDYLSYGDVIMSIALTKMLLLKANYDLNYIDFWCESKKLSKDDYKLLDIYTLRYCLEFMSDIGSNYNDGSKFTYKQEIDRLSILFDDIKKGL